MVKGCQKKTIHIKDTGSRYYEEAYFILRPGVLDDEKCAGSDMVEEALRIVGESLIDPPEKKRRRLPFRYAATFLLGAVAGSALSFAAALLACM